jgi:hypothetical protein
MAQIFGHFSEQLPACEEYLMIVLSPSSAPLQERWSNNSLSADFMGDYFATFFPRSEETAANSPSNVKVKGIVSFIANELLENAMKFHNCASGHPISLTLQLHKDSLVFLATNSIDVHAVTHFQTFITELLAGNPSDLIIHRLEKNFENENNTDSGLGLLTMMSDYLANIGWKFETIQEDPEIITVTTMVSLML